MGITYAKSKYKTDVLKSLDMGITNITMINSLENENCRKQCFRFGVRNIGSLEIAKVLSYKIYII